MIEKKKIIEQIIDQYKIRSIKSATEVAELASNIYAFSSKGRSLSQIRRTAISEMGPVPNYVQYFTGGKVCGDTARGDRPAAQ